MVGSPRDAVSPVAHVRVSNQPQEPDQAQALLQRVVESALKRGGVLFTVHRLSPLDRVRTAPSIRCGSRKVFTENAV